MCIRNTHFVPNFTHALDSTRSSAAHSVGSQVVSGPEALERHALSRTHQGTEFRPLAVRWERKPGLLEAFVHRGFAWIWVDRLLVG